MRISYILALTATLWPLHASEVTYLPALPKPVIKHIICYVIAPQNTEFEKVRDEALLTIKGITNSHWHAMAIEALYERYRDSGMTKLILACELSGEPFIACWIRTYKNTPKELNTAGSNTTPLISALAINSCDTVRLLLQQGADTTLTNDDKTTPLMQAAMVGSVPLITLLLATDSSTLNAVDICGETALYQVVSQGNKEAAELLLARGALTLGAEKAHGYTCLHKAILLSDSPLVELLLNYKADPNSLTRDHNSPLILALLKYGQADETTKKSSLAIITRLLQEPTLDVTVAGKHKITPLHLAVKCQLVDICIATICRQLLAKGADAEAKNAAGMTPRMLAKKMSITL